MDVGLVGPAFEENLSLRYLAASLREARHQPTLLAFNRGQDGEAVVRAARGLPLVGLSLCFQARAPEFLALAGRLKHESPGTVIVAGGHFASCAAEEILRDNPALDAIVVHEGERTIVEIADRIGTHRLPFVDVAGVVHRGPDGQLLRTPPRSIERDLDSLPEPDRGGPSPLCAGIPTAYMLGSRGCVGACTYCCISTLHRLAPGPAFRQRSPASIADEMARLYHEKAVRHFVFHDDNFLTPSVAANRRRLTTLDEDLRCRGVADIAFTIKCRPCDLEPGILAQLRAMGLIRLFLGIETATSEGLACLGRGHTLAEGEQALGLCDEHGVSGQFNILMFHPAATVATLRSDLAFMRRHVHHPLNFCRVEIYAGTPLERRMVAEGKAVGSYLGRSYVIDDPAAERAWQLASRIFHERCWTTGSLMQRAIGLDHLAALAERCHRGRWPRAFRRDVGRWLVEVNHGMLGLLDRIVAGAEHFPALDSAAEPLLLQEEAERRQLLVRYAELQRELGHRVGAGDSTTGAGWLRYAAALALATGIGGCSSSSLVLRRPAVLHEPPPSPASEHATPDAETGSPGPDIGICEYAAIPLDALPSLSAEDVESTWQAASPQFFAYFDGCKRTLPATIRVSIRGRVTPEGQLQDVQLSDPSHALDQRELGGLEIVFQSIWFRPSNAGRSVTYTITFQLR